MYILSLYVLSCAYLNRWKIFTGCLRITIAIMSKIRDIRGALEKREGKNPNHSVESFFDWYTLASGKKKRKILLLLKPSETYFLCISFSLPTQLYLYHPLTLFLLRIPFFMGQFSRKEQSTLHGIFLKLLNQKMGQQVE